MPSSAPKLLYDITSAAAAIQSFCDGRTIDDYKGDLLLRSACERQLGIIGEAMMRLREHHAEFFEQIDERHAIVGFRNRLIHGYDAIDPEIAWEAISIKLPALRTATDRILKSVV